LPSGPGATEKGRECRLATKKYLMVGAPASVVRGPEAPNARGVRRRGRTSNAEAMAMARAWER
jgi:hypothetical protein